LKIKKNKLIIIHLKLHLYFYIEIKNKKKCLRFDKFYYLDLMVTLNKVEKEKSLFLLFLKILKLFNFLLISMKDKKSLKLILVQQKICECFLF
jgi:hypothetical protein